ncbi:Uncharacterised protein [Vibrio cholerae]|nr:Uncharacterised protein [Vibrio cholerae]CSC03076.1 Uncharacterised protein [Vibrio cholerae]
MAFVVQYKLNCRDRRAEIFWFGSERHREIEYFTRLHNHTLFAVPRDWIQSFNRQLIGLWLLGFVDHFEVVSVFNFARAVGSKQLSAIAKNG